MSLEYAKLEKESRLLLEAKLKPLQGTRFQPTGFADLGAARYTLPDGTEMLLVESAQSVANRLESSCLDEGGRGLIAELHGLPYIRVKRDGKEVTNSLIEAHRINSEYVLKNSVLNGRLFSDVFADDINYRADGQVDWDKFRKALLKYDPNSLLHGCFLEEIGGRLRITRAISGFIEASGIVVSESGGVKNNIVQPELKGGEGNVPFHRTEFAAKEIKGYFNLDLALLRGYGLGDAATKLLIVLALFKIRRFLSGGLRLRTACDLEVDGSLSVQRPQGLSVPDETALLDECKMRIAECQSANLFSDPAVTEVEWRPVKKKAKDKDANGEPDEEEAQGR